MLRMLAGLRRWRRRSLRHANETAHMQQWIEQAKALMAVNYALGLELLRCRRLVKGYSDTHARGTSKFDRLLRAAALLKGRLEAAQDLASLHVAAALADAKGLALDNCWHRLGLPGGE